MDNASWESSYQSETTLPFEDIRYSKNAGDFVPFYWMYKRIITPLEALLLIDLWSFKGSKGIFPSQDKLGHHIGIPQPEVSRMVNRIARKTITCPICGMTSQIMEITKQKRKNRLPSNMYSLEPIEDFLRHVRQQHYGQEVKQFVNQNGKQIRRPFETIEREQSELDYFRQAYWKAYESMEKRPVKSNFKRDDF